MFFSKKTKQFILSQTMKGQKKRKGSSNQGKEHFLSQLTLRIHSVPLKKKLLQKVNIKYIYRTTIYTYWKAL